MENNHELKKEITAYEKIKNWCELKPTRNQEHRKTLKANNSQEKTNQKPRTFGQERQEVCNITSKQFSFYTKFRQTIQKKATLTQCYIKKKNESERLTRKTHILQNLIKINTSFKTTYNQ